MKAAPFSFRDSIQYILPLVIGAVLFAPYAAPGAKFELILGTAALFAYVVYSPLQRVVRFLYSHAPFLRGRVAEIREEQEWWGSIWDYDRLFYSAITDKEREYLYLTAAYAEFHRLVSFFLLCYGLLQGWLLGSSLWNGSDVVGAIFGTWTRVMGGWSVSTPLLLVLTGVLFMSSFNNWVSEANDLIRTYVSFAEKYHGQPKPLAKSVWGKVERAGKPQKEVRVQLLGSHGKVLEEEKTDASGRYRFADVLARFPEQELTVFTPDPDWRLCERVSLGEGELPETNVVATKLGE